MYVHIENDKQGVALHDVKLVSLVRGDVEMLIHNRDGVLSIYQNGVVIYTEEEAADDK